MDVFSLALTFFVIADPVGNVPAIASIIKDVPMHRQKLIMWRECFFAFLVAILFQFAGQKFLDVLEINDYALSVAGGVFLFIIALQMIFPTFHTKDVEKATTEPFLVPIAVPLVTGGALMSSIMLYSSLVDNPLTITLALVIAFAAATPILLSAAYVQKILGRSGILALEQLMGLVLVFISTQLIIDGTTLLVASLQKG